MSGLWLLFVLAIWSGLSWALWKIGRRFVLAEGVTSRPLRIGIVAIIVTLWLGVSFWYGGGRKIYYDAEVNRLCRVDGGVKVYETVRLPATEYDSLKKKNWVLPDAKRAQFTDSYFTNTETSYLRSSDPQIAKTTVRFVRRSDRKVLAEFINYGRGGGDLPGPWHGSSHICPDPTRSPVVELQIFVRGE